MGGDVDGVFGHAVALEVIGAGAIDLGHGLFKVQFRVLLGFFPGGGEGRERRWRV